MKTFTKSLITSLIAASAMFSSATRAETPDVSVLTGFGSIHLDQCKCWNQNNTGIGFRIDSGEWKGYAFMVYRNSLGVNSAVLAKEVSLYETEVGSTPVRVGAIMGVVTGYKYVVTPMIVPEVVVNITKNVEIAGVLVPPVPGQTPAVVAVQFRYMFKQ
jgi:hypothetical protein